MVLSRRPGRLVNKLVSKTAASSASAPDERGPSVTGPGERHHAERVGIRDRPGQSRNGGRWCLDVRPLNPQRLTRQRSSSHGVPEEPPGDTNHSAAPWRALSERAGRCQGSYRCWGRL